MKSNSDLSSFDGSSFLRDNRPGYFSKTDIYLMTVMGGWKAFQAGVTVFNSEQIVVTYKYVDHYGAGVEDSRSWLPGLPGMYYLQHYHGTANKYRPFEWDVKIARIINR